MSTHITNPRQFRLYGAVLAMAALLAVLLAVTLTAGPTMAQGPGDDPGPGVPGTPSDPEHPTNETMYDAPVPCSEEAEPGETTERVVGGVAFYPVFEGFWDYEVGHLSENFCPPKVTETTTTGRGGTTTTYTREDANIHISKTAFSVPTSYEVTVVDSAETNGNPSSVTGAKIDLADYPFLRAAVSAVKPGPDSTEANPTTVFADKKVWWVRLDEPGTTADETSNLKMGFSTALMKDADWYDVSGKPVDFQFSAVHVLRAGTLVETHVADANFFAFDERETDTPLRTPLWSDVQTANHSVISMGTEEYKPVQFLFTEPGLYRVQANVRGRARTSEDPEPSPKPPGWEPLTEDDSVNSPVPWYTFHVGPEADLGVAITHTDETSDAGTTVTDGTASFTVTATNNGPETAEGVVVEVNLPAGLSAPATLPANVTANGCGVLSWQVGNLASGASETKNLTANVDSGGPKSLTVDAEVHSSTVDDNERNDTASVVALTNSTVVTPPFFMGVERSIVEHAVPGAHVGEPVAAKNPDGRELSYTLTGLCSDWFTVHSNGQVVLAAGKTLDYDTQATYDLRINVSDGVDDTGAANTAVDHWIPLTIKVLRPLVAATHPALAVTHDPQNPTTDDSVTLTATVSGLSGSMTSCSWTVSGLSYATPGTIDESVCTLLSTWDTAEEVTYTAHIKWEGGGISGSTKVNWSAPNDG